MKIKDVANNRIKPKNKPSASSYIMPAIVKNKTPNINTENKTISKIVITFIFVNFNLLMNINLITFVVIFITLILIVQIYTHLCINANILHTFFEKICNLLKINKKKIHEKIKIYEK